MKALEGTPALAHRPWFKRGRVIGYSAFTALFLVMVIVLLRQGRAPGLAWLALLATALHADAWASVVAGKEAARRHDPTPRAVNPCDLAAGALVVASAVVVPVALAVGPVRAAGMVLLSGLVGVWFLARARGRCRLPASERGWPLTEQGYPLVPDLPVRGWGPHAAILMFGLPLALVAPITDFPMQLVAPFVAATAAQDAAATRRATDAWWSRPTEAFGLQDLLGVVFGCVGILTGIVAAVFLSEWRAWEFSSSVWTGLVLLGSLVVVVRGVRRWKRRHESTALLSVWD